MSAGTGPGAITDDGCPVEVYLRFPPQGEADLVHAQVPAAASVLDLGCGTGRIAHPLAALGHQVVAVDQSAQMLAHVNLPGVVHAPIAGLDLGRTFDAVLMASHLVNTVDDEVRRGFLTTAARHLRPGGVLIAEQYPPEWFEAVGDRSGGRIGDVHADLRDVRRDGDVVTATICYRFGDDSWTQTFSALRLDDEALHCELRGAGLSFERWCSEDRSWFAAVRAG